MQTAIVYDRVNRWGGAERVLLSLHQIFPDAPLYTSVYDKDLAPWASVFPKVYTSFIQSIPFAKGNHEFFPMLMPIAFEQFNFDTFDLVISVSSEAAKGIITRPGTKHICYCLTPTRYLWSHYDEYFKGRSSKVLTKPLVKYLRKWDLVASQRPDMMIAISSTVRERIQKYYDRDSDIIYPPVDFGMFGNTDGHGGFISASKKILEQVQDDSGEGYYLIVSRLVKYKKVDLAIQAFNDLGLPLVVVGIGPEEKKLKMMAKDNISFRGKVSEKELVNLYKGAKAFIFPQDEDFGITAVEAQAAGVPVVAFNGGGAKDTIIDGKTGVFFDKQTKTSLAGAIKRLEQIKFKKHELVSNAKKFSEERFKKEFSILVDGVMKNN